MKISESYDLSWYTKILMFLKPIPLASHYFAIQLKKLHRRLFLKLTFFICHFLLITLTESASSLHVYADIKVLCPGVV